MSREYDLFMLIVAMILLGPFCFRSTQQPNYPTQVVEIKNDIMTMVMKMKNSRNCTSKLHYDLYLPNHYTKILEENNMIFRIMNEIECECNLTFHSLESGKYKITAPLPPVEIQYVNLTFDTLEPSKYKICKL
jgi:hypothetical protein